MSAVQDHHLRDALRETYNKYAEERDASPVEEWKISIRAQFLTLLLQEQKHKFLEIGSGTGRDSAFFQDHGFEVTCIDLSPVMVTLCRQKGLAAYEMDMANLLFPDQSFDAIYAMNSLLHIPKAEFPAIIRRIDALLKPEGLFFLGVYGGFDHEGIWEADHYIPKRFYAFFSDEHLEQEVKNVFEILSFDRIPLEPGSPEHFQSFILRKKVKSIMTIRSASSDLGPFETNTDIGSIHRPGSCAYAPTEQVYTITGAGGNIWGDHDDFHFTWRRMRGDFILTARGAFSGTGVNPHRKLGWMARASLDTSSPMACTAVHGDGLVSLQYRRVQGGTAEEVKAPIHGADVIQLERSGDTFILSVAHFGEPFTTVQVSSIDLGEEVYVGLFVCSHEDEVIEQAAFGDVRIVSPVQPGFDRGRDPFGSRLEILDIASGDRQVIYARDDVFEAPNWTRDGKALIFNSAGHLYSFDLQTKTPITIDTGNVVHNNNDHVLSFDGSRLAISSHGETGHSLIYTVPLLGGQPKQITPIGPSYLHGWSPDGQFLVFTGLRSGDYDIYRVPAAGGEEVQLTTAPGLDDGPEYTPDGRYIYFNSVRSGRMQIWRMRPDGSQQEQLTDDEYNNWFPHIAPDGKQVIFITYLVGEVQPSDHPAAKRVYLRTMPLDGGQPKVVAYLYGGQGTMNVPSWSPDGTKVAFVSNTVPFE